MYKNGTTRRFLDFNDWIEYIYNSVLESKYRKIYVEPIILEDE